MPEAVVIANEEKYLQLKEALSDLPIKVYAGADALSQIVESQPIDIVPVSYTHLDVYKRQDRA